MNWRTHFGGDEFGSEYDIATVQARLNELGADPPLDVDGAMGPMTRAAIVAFQQANGLDGDGVVGPMTAAALGISTSQPSVTPATSGGGGGGKVAMPAFPGFARLSRSDQKAFIKAANRIAPGEPDAPKWLAGIVDFESDRSWSPSRRNPDSGATGLIQFLPSTARLLGTTVSDLATMTFQQQLEYVVRYFTDVTRTAGRIHSLSDMYLSVFSPKGVGRSNDTALYSAGEPGYDQNSGLDHDGKGYITVGDVSRAPASRLHSVADLAPILVPMGIGMGVFVFIGLGAAWYFRKRLFGV